MRIGIDVGGTHTDAVAVVAGPQGNRMVASAKVVTNHHDLLSSVRDVLGAIMAKLRPEEVTHLTLSTTLSTNAIVEGRIEDVGVLVSGGPGIDPGQYRVGNFYRTLSGSIDHRGEAVAAIDVNELQKVSQELCEAGVRVFATIGKFSTRNAAHEQEIRSCVSPCADFVTQGHRMSGQLSFPRRIATAYYNSAVWRVFGQFADAIKTSVDECGITAPIHILKADGGTMPLDAAREFPVESILSGPAASIMGIIALCDITQDAVILDIGGTTTDIAIFSSGTPLVEKEGIAVGGHPTLVRALCTKSIGIGGDSRLHMQDGHVVVGPDRAGPCMAQGGKQPALMDALVYLGLATYGDTDASRSGIEKLAGLWDIYPEQLATAAVEAAVAAITGAVDAMIAEVNTKPVYTIMELLEGTTLRPGAMYVMGGPAAAFGPLLEEHTKYTITVPGAYAVANAIGAALCRATFDLELFADTEAKVMVIPTLGIRQDVAETYSLEEAREDAVKALAARMESLGVAVAAEEIDVLEASSFNMVGDWGVTGCNIRVKCQVRPQVSKVSS